VKPLESLSRHVQDERLLDAYLAAQHREPIDPPVAEHLADCGACGGRYEELAQVMDALRAEGVAEADAVFTHERLRQQHQQVARRIEYVGRAARIISFPGQFVRRTITASSTSPAASRWVAAAAAAGLFIGVALGASYGWGARGARALPGDMRLRPVATQGTDPVSVAADDAFLSELELALERPHTRELLAFDALTPHVREIRDNR
jgi:anti-sigma factor RsiW